MYFSLCSTLESFLSVLLFVCVLLLLLLQGEATRRTHMEKAFKNLQEFNAARKKFKVRVFVVLVVTLAVSHLCRCLQTPRFFKPVFVGVCSTPSQVIALAAFTHSFVFQQLRATRTTTTTEQQQQQQQLQQQQQQQQQQQLSACGV